MVQQYCVFHVGLLAPIRGLRHYSSIGIGQWWHIGNTAAVVLVRCRVVTVSVSYDGMYGNIDCAMFYVYQCSDGSTYRFAYSDRYHIVVFALGGLNSVLGVARGSCQLETFIERPG